MLSPAGNNPDPVTEHARATVSSMTTLLLQADPGRAAEVASHLATLPSVCETVLTSGPYDVIAQAADDADVPMLLAAAKRAPGLARLCVCRSS